jgi:hypothetical protein
MSIYYIKSNMVEYNCKYCKYKTENKYDHKKHCLTKKHVNKVKEAKKMLQKLQKSSKKTNFYCDICRKYYVKKSNLVRHNNTKHGGEIGSIIGAQQKLDILDCDLKSLINIIKMSTGIELVEKTRTGVECSINAPQISPKLAPKYACIYCKHEFTRPSSRSRHEKKCTEMLIKNDRINNQQKVIKAYEQTGKIANKSLSLMGYLVANHGDAPVLQQVDTETKKAIIYKDKLNEVDETHISRVILNYTKYGSLHKYIGDGIISCYKKNDIAEQSIHTSDTSRMNYIIMSSVSDKKTWTKDVKGVTLTEKIIEPVLRTILEMVMNYGKRMLEIIEFDRDEVRMIHSVQNDIIDGKLQKQINLYIAPFFKTDAAVDEGEWKEIV